MICIFDCDYDEGEHNTALYLKNVIRDADIFRMKSNDFPASLEEYDKIIVNGSRKNLVDKLGWMRGLSEIIKTDKLVLGICFGHQMIADMLGANVRKMPKEIFGYTKVNLTPEGEKHPLFKGLGKSFFSMETHQYTVPQISEGAVLLAENENGVQGFSKGNYIGIQFHIDITLEMARKIAADRNISPIPGIENYTDEKKAREKIIKNFLKLDKRYHQGSCCS